MVLLVDVGNTFTKTASLAPDGSLCPGVRLPTSSLHDPARLLEGAWEGVVVASVVPPVAKTLFLEARRRGIPAREVDPSVALQAGVRGVYEGMGQDRIACVLGLAYGWPLPAVALDAGTALTLEVVGEDRRFQGGLILPGSRLMAASLSARCALLPEVVPSPVPFGLATETHSALQVGTTWGFIVMVNGILRLLEECGFTWASLVLTGGDASLLSPSLRVPHALDPMLAFRGMAVAARHGAGGHTG